MSSRIVRRRSSSADARRRDVEGVGDEPRDGVDERQMRGEVAVERVAHLEGADERVPRTKSGAQSRAWQPRWRRAAASRGVAAPRRTATAVSRPASSGQSPVREREAQASALAPSSPPASAQTRTSKWSPATATISQRAAPVSLDQRGGGATRKGRRVVGEDRDETVERAAPAPARRRGRRAPVSAGCGRAGVDVARRPGLLRSPARARRRARAPGSRPAGSAGVRPDCGGRGCVRRRSSDGRCWRSSRAGARRPRRAARSPVRALRHRGAGRVATPSSSAAMARNFTEPPRCAQASRRGAAGRDAASPCDCRARTPERLTNVAPRHTMDRTRPASARSRRQAPREEHGAWNARAGSRARSRSSPGSRSPTASASRRRRCSRTRARCSPSSTSPTPCTTAPSCCAARASPCRRTPPT